jgi:hypothetical protein
MPIAIGNMSEQDNKRHNKRGKAKGHVLMKV